MNDMILTFLNHKNFVISDYYLKLIRQEKLSADELILLIYFINHNSEEFNINDIQNTLGFDEIEALTVFNALIMKKIIKINNLKENGKIKELISVENINLKLMDTLKETEKDNKVVNIFETFEHEFGRTLSPMEYEIINAWLKSNVSEELILGALKEAIYNGVNNLRYIDKIIYEWGKKGFKTMNDVKNYMSKKEDTNKKEELFDYNWLDDEK